MDGITVHQYGNKTVIKAIEGVADANLLAGGVCGVWSVKDIIAHLAVSERVLVELLQTLLGATDKPLIDTLFAQGSTFNDTQVALTHDKTFSEVWKDYTAAYRQSSDLLAQIPPEQMRQKGIVSWYGEEYDLEDIIAYSYYGHKREHCAQIIVFRDSLKDGA